MFLTEAVVVLACAYGAEASSSLYPYPLPAFQNTEVKIKLNSNKTPQSNDHFTQNVGFLTRLVCILFNFTGSDSITLGRQVFFLGLLREGRGELRLRDGCGWSRRVCHLHLGWSIANPALKKTPVVPTSLVDA